MEKNPKNHDADDGQRETAKEVPTAERGIDRGLLASAAFAFEQEVGREGWDQPMYVFTLNRLADNAIGFTPFLECPREIPPAGFLEMLADGIQDSRSKDRLPGLLGDGYFGLAIAYEGWARFGEAALTTEAGKSLADQVGSVECRILHLRTAGGQEVMVHHARGQEPGQLPATAAGQVPDALQALMGAIQEALPPEGL